MLEKVVSPKTTKKGIDDDLVRLVPQVFDFVIVSKKGVVKLWALHSNI